MVASLGTVLLLLALAATVIAFIALLLGLLKKVQQGIVIGRRAILISTLLLLAALVLLVVAFITDQFQVEYVALHSNQALPLHLKITAIWAGQEGSLLLWAFLQALFATLVSRKADQDDAISQWALLFLSLLVVFFVLILIAFSDPFVALAVPPTDGQGMNPLLRHPGMIFHPPFLYIGYVGLAVPFAYALAALVVGKVGEWPGLARNWLLVAWVALGLGIFLGMRWAYDVLGWGGYWGWDAVENAGLMPWLTATALLHGLVMQERGKGFKVWNLCLAALSYALVLFGTFTTRSGMIDSVHAFSRSNLGPYFLGMIVLVLVGTLVMMIVRRKTIGELVYPDKLFSREGAFFFTLLLLMLITLSILLGTLLPNLTGGRFTASAEWFNRVVGPQLAALVFLMGICPYLGRLMGPKARAFQKLCPSLAGMAAMGILAVLKGYTAPKALIGLLIAGFVAGAALGEIGGIIKRRIQQKRLSDVGPLLGGHLVHLGIALMAIGVIGTQMYTSSETFSLSPGETVTFGGYKLNYTDISQQTDEDRLITEASLSVYQDQEFLKELTPQLVYYPSYQQTMAEPAIHVGWDEDLYLVLFQLDMTGTILLSVTINPLSSSLWVGGLVLLVGGVIAWWPGVEGEGENAPPKQRFINRLGVILGLLVLVILTVTLWGDSLRPGKNSGRPLLGASAPPFSATALDGTLWSFEEHLGNVVIVHFWATWCPQCEDELAAFQRLSLEYQPQGVHFVGVAMNDEETAVQMIAEDMDLSFPLIVEREGVITAAYGVTAVPETLVIGSDGKVVYFHIGVVDETTLWEEIETLLSEEQ